MNIFSQPTRRHFLQSTTAAVVSLILPRSIFATTPDPNFHFVHTESLNSWPIPNPITWSIQNAHEPIMARAADGLATLTPADGDRIIRLVVRRCSLNLLELQGNQVHVQFWGTNGQADLKPFFKTHGLARPEIVVVLRDRKKETVTTLTGDSFLFGDRFASDFPLELFQKKWTRRFVNEPNDSQAAPGTASGFAWDGIEDDLIPWVALKSAWRRGCGVVCLNCSGETLLANFGFRQVGMFNRASSFEYVCGACRRSFKDSVEDVGDWIVANLEEGVRPDAEMVWGKRLKLESRS